MKNMKIFSLKTLLLVFIAVVISSCERTLSGDVVFATFPNNPEVFIDGFSGGLEYLPFAGSKLDAFTVDSEVRVGEFGASMRFDVPNVGDPAGTFAGAIFPDNGGRDLTGYDALTFYARASQGSTINEIGFGNDFGDNTYLVALNNLKISTAWTKYTIPIPDPSKLVAEKGMFWYAAGAEGPYGHTFWIDELKYEKLGTVAQPRPAIFGGVDKTEDSFNGATFTIDGLTQTFNLASGLDQTVAAAPSYFEFKSSNVDVARVSELGVVTVVGAGEATITALLAGVKAKGSLTITSSGNIALAPTPTAPVADVISLFSDAYTNVPVDFFNGFYGGSTTETADIVINNDNLKYYTKLNFVGIEFGNPTVNATAYNFLHLDILTNNSTSSNFQIKVRDRGSNGVLNTDIFTGNPLPDDKEITFTVTPAQITNGEWLSIDIPLTGDIATQKNNLAQIVFVGDIDFLLDNLYFYK
ncbi:MAG: Ig-like domain-containing protein [Cyclobacteriaceae bacterium]